MSEAAARTQIRDLCDLLFAATPEEAARRAKDAKLI